MTKAWSLVAITLVAACGSPKASAPPVASGDSPGVVSRDSAGIEIVETGAPVWGDTVHWRVDTAPALSIGEADGADPYLFSMIAGAIRRKDGSVVVADGSTRELRVFDSTGHFVGSKGRRGPGPAEFTGIERIARCGPDELWIDARKRISVWSLELEYRREFVVTQSTMWPLVCFGGTGVLVKQDLGDVEDHMGSTIQVDTLNLMAVDSLGRNPRDLQKIPLYSRLFVASKRIGIVHPFAPVTVLAAAGPDVVMGSGERMEVRTYSRSWQLLRIVRGPSEDLVLTSLMRRDYREAELTGWDKEEREGLEIVGNPMPETIPAYTALLVDSEGNTWAKRFSRPGSVESRWGVFGRDGAFLGHTLLPQGLKVLEIGADYILGSVRDSLFVEQVRLHRLHK